MERICLVVDFDGFQLRNRPFMPREVGYVPMEDEEPGHYSFDLSASVELRDEKDRKSVWYCRKFLHGLPLYPRRNEMCRAPEFLDDLLQQLYEEHKTEDKDLVAYKGGVCEKVKLEQLGIPSVNLEDFGCPKFDRIKDFYPKLQGTCWLHDKPKTGDTFHCVVAEVLTFKAWVQDNLNAKLERSLAKRTISKRRLLEISNSLA